MKRVLGYVLFFMVSMVLIAGMALAGSDEPLYLTGTITNTTLITKGGHINAIQIGNVSGALGGWIYVESSDSAGTTWTVIWNSSTDDGTNYIMGSLPWYEAQILYNARITVVNAPGIGLNIFRDD